MYEKNHMENHVDLGYGVLHHKSHGFHADGICCRTGCVRFG